MIQTKLPILEDEVYTATDANKYQSQINVLKNRFGAMVDEIAQIVGLNDFKWLIYSVMFRENGQGNVNFVKSTGATGLMQVTPETASDVIIRENQKHRITNEEEAMLTTLIGSSRTKALLKRKQLGEPILFSINDLKNPKLNLLIACIYIGQLVDECTEGGELNLAKVITRYLRYYSKPQGKTAQEVIAWVNKQGWSKNQKDENIDYIKVVGGKRGIATLAA